MGIPSDEVVQIRHPDVAGDPTVVTISCPDKTGLGCDLCRVVLLFGLNVLKGDMSTDGRWCYIVLWVVARRGRTMAWDLLKERLVELCPVSSLCGLDSSYLAAAGLQEDLEPAAPRVFLLKFSCYDRMGLLHDVTHVLSEMELTIRRVKVSTTPDGRVMDLFFITDARDLLHTKNRREEAYEKLQSVLGDSVTSCEIECATEDMSSCLQASALLPPLVVEQMFNTDLIEEQLSRSRSSSKLSVTMDNSLSPVHSLIQIQCGDHKGLLYDIMRTLKDCDIQISYSRFYAGRKDRCEVDLFAVQSDGKKILDQQKQRALCSRLRMELLHPLRVALVNRGPDMELLVANPVEISGKGRPLVLHDITLALKNLHRRIFLAEIGRHVVDDREWEVYRVHLGEDDHELSCAVRRKIVDGVTNMLMGWE
ncbi:ACT domain-containing protein ACR10 [Brachypodium distachyon]|uniref:ACT domain-containing protein ACR n=1 Tax=Brachypodium distachyon TaxID=15368 RepID=I1IT47_BRADI|nr:ACT domain-containing protein ACR10 [Brachypodium distachyon]KQJ91634.1 hypothetical protein BRADI_4g38810v3 [Brachypodium distachyon]|eukprot:XP_003578696.1 ACT domain-containing protein ACR10 [Brachypodium distachyon]